jgi:hypothetical protein
MSCSNNPCEGDKIFTPAVLQWTNWNEYTDLSLPYPTPYIYSPGENYVYPLSEQYPRGISYPDGTSMSYLDQLDNSVLGVATDDSVVSFYTNVLSGDYGNDFSNTFFTHTDRNGFNDNGVNKVFKLANGLIYRIWPFLGEKINDKILFKVLNPTCGTNKFCNGSDFFSYGYVNHSCSDDRMCNVDANMYGLNDPLQVQFDLYYPSNNSYPQALGLNQTGQIILGQNIGGWTPKTNWFGKRDNNTYIWNIEKNEYELSLLGEQTRKNTYFRPIILKQNNYVRAWINVNSQIDNLINNGLINSVNSLFNNEIFTELKYAFLIKLPSQNKYLTINVNGNNSELIWATTDFTTNTLNFYWFIVPINTVEATKFIFINVGTQRVLYNTSNIDQCINNFCGKNCKFLQNIVDKSDNNLSMNISKTLSTQLIINNENKILSCDSNNKAIWEYIKIYPKSLGTQNYLGNEYSENINDAEISNKFKIEIMKTILPGSSVPVEWNPTNLQYYAPLLFCCNESSTTLDPQKVGNLLSASATTSQRNNVCSVTDLKDQTCNQATQTICNSYYPEPKNSQNKIIPMLYNPELFSGTSTTQEIWNKYKEWAQLSTPESKMCHCFVSDTYLRTYYREQLYSQLEQAKTNEKYAPYAGFLQTLIDEYVYSRYPIKDPINTEQVSDNPFYTPSTSFIPGRCYDSTCQTGFEINMIDPETKLRLPYYIDPNSGTISQQACGSSSQGVDCTQFVLNIVEKSSANVENQQSQNCGTNSLGANPFQISVDPFSSCSNTNNDIKVQFDCPWNPFNGSVRNEQNIQTCKLSFQNYFNNNKNAFNSTEAVPNITVEPIQNASPVSRSGTTFYKYQATIPCGTTGEPTVFTRWVCNNLTNTCSSIITNDETKGFATENECQNNCKSTVPQTYTRYICQSNNVCVTQTVTDPNTGYVTLTDCLNNCKPSEPTSSSSKTGLIIGLVIFFLLVLGGLYYYFKVYKKRQL